ncbi:MAG: hypothetical protein HQL64_06640 [Magnetococcales bacterium]|nr:hypothetical protein [Magnetococcales bacterium]
MAESSQDFITRIVALIRENRVEEARRQLDEVGERSPESVARWYLFARLLVASLGEGDIEAHLQPFGRAPGHAFRSALAALKRAMPTMDPPPTETPRPPAAASPTTNGVEVVPAPESQPPEPHFRQAASGERPDVARLHLFLERIQALSPEDVTPAAALERLTSWATRMETGRDAVAGFSMHEEAPLPTWLIRKFRPCAPLFALFKEAGSAGQNPGQQEVFHP